MFNIDKLLNILFSMGIIIDKKDTNIQNLMLEEDLSFDSQEIVELISEIRESLGMERFGIYIKRNDTISTVINKVNCLFDETDFSRSDEIIIHANIEKVRKYIWDISRWEKLLDHIEKIELLFEQDNYQEFNMNVKSTFGVIEVQSNRLRIDDKIYFNQPCPPKYLDIHKGIWILKDLDDKNTKINLIHKWKISDNAMLYFKNTHNVEEEIERELKTHAEQTLNMWKGILDD